MASTAAGALAAVQRAGGGFGFALLDFNLADDSTSLPVAEELHRLGVPFAFATGYGAAGLPEGHAHRPCLPKPFQERELVAVLAQALAG